jgi:hypothetical protein
VGDLLYSTILSYFTLNNLQYELTAGAAGMVSFKAPSYGLFKTSLKPQYWFGIPRNVSTDGSGMDVDRIEHQVVEKNNDQEQWKAWNRASGARMSAMEHLVTEMMFSTEHKPALGISAVKAIQLAAAEGQKIWTITQTNLNTALAAINLPSDIETDIRNSVNAGMEVTAHEAAVDFYGSSQVGYIVIDPETGAGGYLIGGGENEGLTLFVNNSNGFLAWFSVLAAFGKSTGTLFPVAAWVAVATLAIAALDIINYCSKEVNSLIFSMFLFMVVTVFFAYVIPLLFSIPLISGSVGAVLTHIINLVQPTILEYVYSHRNGCSA